MYVDLWIIETCKHYSKINDIHKLVYAYMCVLFDSHQVLCLLYYMYFCARLNKRMNGKKDCRESSVNIWVGERLMKFRCGLKVCSPFMEILLRSHSSLSWKLCTQIFAALYFTKMFMFNAQKVYMNIRCVGITFLFYFLFCHFSL